MRKKILIGSILLSFSLFGQDIYQESVNKLEMTELSNTYSKEKIERSLKGYKKLKKEKLEELASKAVLVDLQAITVDDLNYSKNINLKLENYISNFKDISENSLGNISDKNIIERINRKYSTFKVIEKNSLIDSLNIALAKKLTTGYNIKIKSTYANFNPELSLSYGHNGINMLISLLLL